MIFFSKYVSHRLADRFYNFFVLFIGNPNCISNNIFRYYILRYLADIHIRASLEMHTLAALSLFVFASLEVDMKGDRSKIDETTVS